MRWWRWYALAGVLFLVAMLTLNVLQ